ISTAFVLDVADLAVPMRQVDAAHVEVELTRLDRALADAVRDVERLRDDLSKSAGKEIAGIFDFHIGLLRDKSLLGQIRNEIQAHRWTAEYAVNVVMKRHSLTFLQMKDRYLSERVKDIYDLERRILRHLIGQQQTDLTRIKHEVILIAHDLLPSQTAQLDKSHVKGFAVDVGGRTSHTAIVARAMGIPAVVGVGDVSSRVAPGDTVIVDGTRGVIIINPEKDQLTDFDKQIERHHKIEIELALLRDEPATTKDGVTVNLQANIEFPNEIDDALGHGANGIGLYRTEFLYLESAQEPTEADHYNAYADALTRLKGRPLVIRTLDLGADKYDPNRVGANAEPNPFLGDRSIRLCLHDIPMFKRQLRAILRASVLGDVRIMFPMISTLMELRQARLVLSEVMEELDDEGLKFNNALPVGMMVEVPSAALMAAVFAREVNFFSIGTNDLIQYTVAVDRTNERVAGLFNAAHPAVLLLIRDVIRAGARGGIPVSVCGEMAGEPEYTLLLLGLGLTTFSMNAPDVPEIKKIIRSATMPLARDIARKVMGFDSERQVLHYLREETRKLVPEVF
ncbi:MAG TPA: phosphoenolpyruvate--protein phosphotransferase, partial [Tepidisphaeraceae bacterium]|nr:phosphoenolpyruvate--protein phosphotransferase [Tepidisphaeraceae bacterium]